MIKAVIADTTPLYALVDSSDQYHLKARQELSQIQQFNLQVMIPYPIVLETYTLVLYRLGIQRAIKFSE
ncbi:MAG TPA: hypothetical protein V6D21_25250 [Candidatus Obscuribacterales bacterium]